jgi:demethylmenaquinone methyltransferase/2-methoxy-6-polyprenyl-1,4-benzoquinol methylase
MNAKSRIARDCMTNYTGPDPAKIRSMFAAISKRYDRANTVLSGGVHHLWRRRAVKRAGVKPGDRVLDCATGTGDLAIAFRNAGAQVTGTDFVPEMIALARAKAGDITFEVADVTKLPFEDNSFDVASISFGIRNVGEPRKGIAEMARVVRSGGRVLVLEFGQPRSRAFGTMYNWYSQHVLPRLGGAVTGEEAAYRYLQTSSEAFPCGEEFVQLMRESADFAAIDFVPLTFGIAYLYRGVKK